MLVLSRRNGESIVIGGGITVTVLEVRGNVLRLGIEAPEKVRILRTELYEHMKDSDTSPASGVADGSRPTAPPS